MTVDRVYRCALIWATGIVITTFSAVAAAASAQRPYTVAVSSPMQRVQTQARKLVTLDLKDVPVADIIQQIEKQSNARISYSRTVVPVEKPISLTVKNVSAEDALETALKGLGLRVYTAANGQIVIEKPVKSSPQGTPGVIRGKVTDSTKRALGQVRVSLDAARADGTPIVVVTNAVGEYVLTGVPAGDRRLTARILGYGISEQRVSLDAGDTITVNIVLAQVATWLTEVVTTATGARERLEVGNSTTLINADSIVQRAPIRNITDLLATRVPGAQVMATSGEVGSGSQIRIRGTASMLANNDPIVIVDGIRVESQYTTNNRGDETPADNQVAQGASAMARLNDLDPETIESIEVLRGPSASALYGSEAAPGVIVIKTKRGRPGSMRWSFSTNQSITSMKASFTDSYRAWGYSPSPNYAGDVNCFALPRLMGACMVDSVSRYNPLSDKSNSPFGTGYGSSYFGSVSGGSDKLQYFGNASYEDNTGLLKMPAADKRRLLETHDMSSLPRWMLRPNAMKGTTLGTRLTSQHFRNATVSLSVNHINRYHRSAGMSGGQSFVRSAMRSPGYKDSINYGWGGPPPSEVFSIRAGDGITRTMASLNADLRLLPSLTARVTGGIDYSDREDEWFTPQGYSRTFPNGRRALREGVTKTYTLNWNGAYQVNLLQNLAIRTVAGTQYMKQGRRSHERQAQGLPEWTSDMGQADTVVHTIIDQGVSTLGVFLESTFALNDRLFVPVSFRIDRSSSFGNRQRGELFPKISASWILSEEPFFRPLLFDALSNIRLRMAIGQAGVQPKPDAVIRTYRDYISSGNDTSEFGLVLNGTGNSQVRPERSVEFEGGIDAGFWNDRLLLEFTLYNKRTNDALVLRELPPSFGVVERQENLGLVENRGTEVSVSMRPIDRRVVRMNVVTALSKNANKLVRLGSGVTLAPNEEYREGYPLNAFFDREIVGYHDANGNGVIEPGDVVLTDSVVYIGQRLPKFSMSLRTDFGFLNDLFTVGAGFMLQDGMTQVNDALLDRCRMGVCRQSADPSVSPEQQVMGLVWMRTLYPYYETVSWFRWNDLSFGFNAPPSVAARFNLRSLRISLMGRNLGMWSKYRGADPEVNTNPGGPARDAGGIPMTRDWVLRINVGF